MSRGLTANVVAELDKQLVRPVFFVELETEEGFERAWTGYGEKTWNALTWEGTGTLVQISNIPEGGDNQAEGIVLTLILPVSSPTPSLTGLRQGMACKVWIGFLDSSEAVIADPYQAFAGRVDAVRQTEAGSTSTVEISVENNLIDLKRPRRRYYTHEDQQTDYPGDMGFEFVAELAEKKVVWGNFVIPRR